ncbi:MAG: hypothetical protein ASARMPREDX12_004751 [Alectoria sarmentosa]|nr:MAG: hypothetical protein ASARMPREDX12_004751 [Alectoria sarmentosa]
MAPLTSDQYLRPAMEAPPGLHSNLIDPSSTDYLTIIVCVLILVLSTPFVALRLYTRQFITSQVWWDDGCCVLGWIFEIALTGLLLKALDYGGGTDLWNLFQNMEILARTGMCFTKSSIILLYQRLFLPPGTGRSHIWWSIWVVFYWNLLSALALIITAATECVGRADKVSKGEECLDQYAILVCASVINVVSDLMILVIPISAIWGLHMAKEKKLKLGAVFAVGSLGVLASVARLAYQIPEAKKPNQTIIVMNLMELNVVEHMIGLIVSSMPTLPAFIHHLRSGPTSTPASFEPRGQHGIRKTSEISVLWFKRSSKPGRGRGATGTGLDDPSLLYTANSGYLELTDFEGQKGMPTKRDRLEGFTGGMTTTTVGIGDDAK